MYIHIKAVTYVTL